MADHRRTIQKHGWDEFAEIYWPLLVSWLERQGASPHNAQDLVQGFFEKLWDKGSIAEQLRPESGRLRSFLLTSLQNWQRDQYRSQNTQKRGGDSTPLELREDLADVPHNPGGHDFHYDQEWARVTLKIACQKLRQEYQERDQTAVFDLGITLLDDRDPQKTKDIADQLNMKSNALNVSLKRLRERLGRSLRDEVAETLFEPTSNMIDDELRYLLEAFGRHQSFSDILGKLLLHK